MTTAARQGVLPRWVLPFLAAIAAVVAVLVGPSQASASTSWSTTSVAETRVGASTVAGRVLVGAADRVCAGQRLGEEPAGREVAVATGVAANGGDALLSTGASGAGKRLPMNMQTVCDVACKYDIDISDVAIKIDKSRAGYFGSTAPNQTVTLTRSAFANEEQLARTLAHERFHVDQIRSGMGYPATYDAGNAWEAAAQAFEDAWWAAR